MPDNLLTIESDTFNALRNDFNMILKKTLDNMINKAGNKAELKLSLQITFAA